MHVSICRFPSPVGTVTVAWSQSDAVAGVWLDGNRETASNQRWLERRGFTAVRTTSPPGEVVAQFDAYFASSTGGFNLPLLKQGSSFERAVWRELGYVPFGETITYGELADALGVPGEAQRVGQACAANPWLIVIPCHRVIASDGSLRGYAAGLPLKRRLLAHERGQQSLGVI